jgi:uncharacterized damage-inducible protein DinB
VEQILALLAEGPPRIAALTASLPPDRLHAAPGDSEWSANEVLAHLRACADVWGDCIATVLAQERPTIRAINPRTWIGQTDYLEQAFQPSLRAFTAQRADLLAVLERLPPAGWSRGATVVGAGRPLERTVLSYAQWMAEHERPHVKQIARIARQMQR